MTPVITFLSDYGYRDEFAGVCHGVIARRCPQARVIDITHGITRHDIRFGALVLRGALAHMPSGVHLAVVDPQVGGAGEHSRRAVALRVAHGERLLVGPDNGLLALAAERFGGASEAVDIGRSPERLEPVSATFHGRDIFAPVAAALAAGTPLDELGEPLPVHELRGLELPSAREEGPRLRTHVLYCDHFGNVILDATHEQLARLGMRLGEQLTVGSATGSHTARYARTFADVAEGELLLYEDAEHMVALAVNRGSASQTLRAQADEELILRPS